MPVSEKMMALLDPDHPEHREYVRLVDEVEMNYVKRSQNTWSTIMDYWDLYLAEQDDPRDSVDENWKSFLGWAGEKRTTRPPSTTILPRPRATGIWSRQRRTATVAKAARIRATTATAENVCLLVMVPVSSLT